MQSSRSCLVIFAISLLAGSLLSGCTGLSRYVEDMDRDESSLVFGYVDMSGAASDLEWAALHPEKPGTDGVYLRIADGLFYRENLSPGSYFVTTVAGMDKRMFGLCGGPRVSICCLSGNAPRTELRYDFGDFEKNPTSLKIERGGIYFVGSYACENVSGGLMRAATFELKRVKSPSEAELLKHLLPRTKGTKWEARVRSRLDELQK